MSDICNAILPAEVQAALDKERLWISQSWLIQFCPGYFGTTEGPSPGVLFGPNGPVWLCDIDDLRTEIRNSKQS